MRGVAPALALGALLFGGLTACAEEKRGPLVGVEVSQLAGSGSAVDAGLSAPSSPPPPRMEDVMPVSPKAPTAGGTSPLLAPPARLRGRIDVLAPEVDDVAFNRELLTTFIRKRAPALLHCYEYELKINPNTKGTLKVRFNIKPTGRATVPELEENTLGSAGLASCAKTVIGSWVFPFKPEEEVPVVSVFVFAPAQ